MKRSNPVENTENVELNTLEELDRPALLSDGQQPGESLQSTSHEFQRSERCRTSDRELLRNRGCLTDE